MKTVSKEFLLHGANIMKGIVKMHNLVSEMIKYENPEEFDNFFKYVNSLEGDVVVLSDYEFDAFTRLINEMWKDKEMVDKIFNIIKEYD